MHAMRSVGTLKLTGLKSVFSRTTSGLSNIFPFPAFFRKLWNIQNTRMVVDSKVDTLHHATVYECVHEKVIPTSLLCQQVTFKLSATTPL